MPSRARSASVASPHRVTFTRLVETARQKARACWNNPPTMAVIAVIVAKKTTSSALMPMDSYGFVGPATRSAAESAQPGVQASKALSAPNPQNLCNPPKPRSQEPLAAQTDTWRPK